MLRAPRRKRGMVGAMRLAAAAWALRVVCGLGVLGIGCSLSDDEGGPPITDEKVSAIPADSTRLVGTPLSTGPGRANATVAAPDGKSSSPAEGASDLAPTASAVSSKAVIATPDGKSSSPVEGASDSAPTASTVTAKAVVAASDGKSSNPTEGASDRAPTASGVTANVVVSTPRAKPNTSAGGAGVRPPIFTDVTASAGIDFTHSRPAQPTFPLGAGAIVFDYDNDGHDDIYLSVSKGPNSLYRNNGGSSFTDVAAAAGVDDPGGVGNGGCAADYDNDGDQDLFVTNDGSSTLFRNNGDGTFEDVTEVTKGDFDVPHRNTGCAWGDYDQDGYLDLIVVRHLWEAYATVAAPGDIYLSIGGLTLYHNVRDGLLFDVTYLLGDPTFPDSLDARYVERNEPGRAGNAKGLGFQPGWVDFDNDGDLDLYVVNDFGSIIQRNVLWRNDGAGTDGSWTFVDVSADLRADMPMFGMGLAVGDYDLDGFLDMYMTNIGDNVLLKNGGGGRGYTDTAAKARAGVGSVGGKNRVAWGAVFFDYDNDGDEDLYVVSGFLDVPNVDNLKEQPNVLLKNQGNGTFADVSLGSGADDPGIGRGGVYLDFDKDGCLDLFVANYGQRARLFRNVCDYGNNWLEISTVGATSNRDGIGARITVVSGGISQIREVSAGSSSMSQNMSAAHFGLDNADAAEYVLVRWPSGRVQTLTDVAANQRLTVIEPE